MSVDAVPLAAVDGSGGNCGAVGPANAWVGDASGVEYVDSAVIGSS